MIVKRNFDPRKVTMYVWQQLVVALVLAFVFAIVQRTGEVNEEPFENRITDVPLTALCRIIERDARATLGETGLPPRLEPKDGYLW